MEENKYLNEENYERGKKKITTIAILVLVFGLLIGGILITTGIIKQRKVNSNYSSESKANLQNKLETEKQKLEDKKAELIAKGIEYKSYAKYDDGESYDLYVITKALDPSFDHCAFDEYKNNSLTSSYCSLKNQLKDNTDFNKSFDSFSSIPFYMFGAFIIIATCMISGSIYVFAKRREIAAFTTQQVMPVAKEGIEGISPSIGKAAKDISKGIAEGINEANKK